MFGRNSSQWAQATPERQQFFKNAMRPDLVSKDGGPPKSPCCGEADAYEADEFDTANGNLYAILTCNDPDNCNQIPNCDDETITCRPPIPRGTRIKIRPDAILPPRQPINLTGHGWVFISASTKYVFCYAFPAGG